MRLMNRGFGWKCSGLSLLGTRMWDSDEKTAASPWQGLAVCRLTGEVGTTSPLHRRGH